MTALSRISTAARRSQGGQKLTFALLYVQRMPRRRPCAEPHSGRPTLTFASTLAIIELYVTTLRRSGLTPLPLSRRARRASSETGLSSGFVILRKRGRGGSRH